MGCRRYSKVVIIEKPTSKILFRRKKFQFKIEEILGRGSFGQVVKAIDYQTNRRVAIKGTANFTSRADTLSSVIKNDASFFNQAQIEIKLLKLLANKMQQNSEIV